MRAFFIIVSILFAAPSARADLCARMFANPGTPAEPTVIILSAPSGGGKTTLAQLLVKDYGNLSLSVSTTTRAPRGQEKNGVDYHFLSADDFKSRIAGGQFAEWAEVHGNFYGTDIGTIRDEFARGHSVIALLDVQGAAKLREAMPGKVVTIFVQPPNMKVLEQRLRDRGTDTEAAIQLRLANAQKEMAEAPKFDITVTNDDLDTAIRELKEIIAYARLIP